MIRNLKKIRKLRKYTQQQLANLLNISRLSIVKFENEEINPNIETLVKLANVLQCSTDYLLGLKETEN